MLTPCRIKTTILKAFFAFLPPLPPPPALSATNMKSAVLFLGLLLAISAVNQGRALSFSASNYLLHCPPLDCS